VNQTIKKINIENVSEEEAMKCISTGMLKLESATLEQLKASLVGLAETFVATTTECDEQTTFALVMEIISNTLDENMDAVSLHAIEPLTKTTN